MKPYISIKLPLIRCNIPFRRDANKVWQIMFDCPLFYLLITDYANNPAQKISKNRSVTFHFNYYIHLSK